jgi:hypothetical protein
MRLRGYERTQSVAVNRATGGHSHLSNASSFIGATWQQRGAGQRIALWSSGYKARYGPAAEQRVMLLSVRCSLLNPRSLCGQQRPFSRRTDRRRAAMAHGGGCGGAFRSPVG